MVGGGWNGAWIAAAIDGIAPALRGGAMAVAVALLSGACGDDGGGGTAGGPSEPGKLGERCGAGCETGLVCSSGGVLANVCTVGCTTDQSCLLLAPGKPARCFGQVNAQCALACDAADDCPAGLTCGLVSGAMACVAM
jgi:hypothetical protein